MPFVQIIGRHKYILVPVVQESFNGHAILKGVDLYTTRGDYKGFWPVANILGDIHDEIMEFMERTSSGRVPHLHIIKHSEDLP